MSERREKRQSRDAEGKSRTPPRSRQDATDSDAEQVEAGHGGPAGRRSLSVRDLKTALKEWGDDFQNTFATTFAEKHIAPLTREVQSLSVGVTKLTTDVESLQQRVTAIEAGSSRGLSPGPSPNPAPTPQVPPRAKSAGPSGALQEKFVPLRIEILNLQEYARQMQDAMDEAQCELWITRLFDTMSEGMRDHLLPLQEQLRRNSRALVFMPSLHVRPDVSSADRLRLISHVKDQLSTGAFNHKAGTPRARWEPSAAQKPVNRLMAQVHRLHERLTGKVSSLATWRVQPRGTLVELWSMDGRPSLVLVVNPSLSVLQSAQVGTISADTVREEWAQVVAEASRS